MIFKSPYPDVDIPDIDLTRYFLQRIGSYGKKTAVINGITNQSFSFEQLADAIQKTAYGLHKRGLVKGDVFAIYSPNLPEYIIAFHAISLIGGTVTTINPLYTTEEMKVRSGNPNFTYEISCDQMCGAGHFSMRGVIIVETMEEYKKWLAEQKAEYFTVYPDKAPKEIMIDSVKAKPTAQLLPVKK